MPKLFSPITLGDLSLANRVVMAPLTRLRSGGSGVPGDLVATHYAQRATIGLIVTEGTYSSPSAQGFPGQPGLVTPAQIAGWHRVTDAVHAAGGTIVAQVMHAGRVTHPQTNGGHPVVAPSAIAIDGQTHTPGGRLAYPVPHALTTDEIGGVVAEFVTASRHAIEAGFAGVEIHSANGYLLHEFLAPSSNTRHDGYGGSPENRARLTGDVVRAVADAIGAGRVGLRISPAHNIQDVLELDAADLEATYGALVDQIAPLGLAYLSILHSEPSGDFVQGLRTRFGGPVIVNSGFGTITSRDEVRDLIDHDYTDAVAVGRLAIANPDLVRRWQEDRELNEIDPSTFYSPDAAGYTDYPALRN